LADNCYSSMFYGCMSLTQPPTLPATILKGCCYADMFRGCTALTNAPALPAVALANSCYEGMFYDCTALTAPPELPATTLADRCYAWMFYECTALELSTAAPGKEWKIPATSTMAVNWGMDMFTGTGGTLQGQPTLNTMYYVVSAREPNNDCITFSSAASFTLKTANTSKNWDGTLWISADKTYWTEWNGIEVSAAQIGGMYKLFVRGNEKNSRITASDRGRWVLVGSADIDCAGNIETLRGAKGNDPSPTPMVYVCYSYMFRDCTLLTSAPELPAKALRDFCYNYMFSGCTSLTNAPALPATTLAESCYSYMFSGCTSLVDLPELPATTLAESCYSYMFSGCTSLVDLPELPATTLADYCYYGMFFGCTSLMVNATAPGKEWKIPATSTTATGWGSYMFSGTCGTLQGRPKLSTTYYVARALEPNNDCITFSSAELFTLKTANTSKNWDGTLWTSTDKINWAEWKGAPVSAAKTGSMYYLYVHGNTSNTKIAGQSSNYRWVLTGNNIACTGNIETLRGATGDNTSPTTMATSCYEYMFQDCTALMSAPALPAMTLADDCYKSMFYWCTSLTNAPALPAMTLADGCYWSMFEGCTSLKTAPELPATTLADWCYSSMFESCKLLTSAPELPATTLADGCYSGIFQGCTALTTAPALPATTLAYRCYEGVFSHCTALTNAPTLPATTLAEECYLSMFYGCTSLTSAPTLLATTLGVRSCCYMFYDCTSLMTAPVLLATTLADSCYENMFWGCTSLTTSPTLPATTLAEKCYQKMFAYCTALTTAPALPATVLAINCYSGMFYGCTSLTSAPELPATTLADFCYKSMFYWCAALTTAPVLPATTLADDCYGSMFEGCASLKTMPALSATTLKEYCYSGMFALCTSLTYVSTLPATTLAWGCYSGMFNGCTALELNAAAPGKEWKLPMASTTVSYWGKDMFKNTSGTLQGQPELNTTYYIASALPDPVEPGGEIVVPEGKAGAKAAEINGDPTVKAQYLKAPEGVETTIDYLGCFDAVATSGSTVAFVLNENGSNEVVEAAATVNAAALDTVFSASSTVTIAEPLVGFYYSLRQGGNVSVAEKADLNKLGGRDIIGFELTKGPIQYFYQTIVTPQPIK